MEENRAQGALFFYGSVQTGNLDFFSSGLYDGKISKYSNGAIYGSWAPENQVSFLCLLLCKEEITDAAIKKTATANR